MDRWTCILLSAGKSERTGTPKGMIPVDGEPWIEKQCRAIQSNGECDIVIVLGHHFETYLNQLGDRFRVVKNPEPELGQFSSIQTGLKAVSERRNAFVLPIDVPCPSKEVWTTLRENLTDDRLAAIPTLNGKGGHPTLLAAPLIQKILTIPTGEGRLDKILHEIPAEKVVRVPVLDSAICENWNHPESFPGSPN